MTAPAILVLWFVLLAFAVFVLLKQVAGGIAF